MSHRPQKKIVAARQLGPRARGMSGTHALDLPMGSGEYRAVRGDDEGHEFLARERELPVAAPRVCDTVRLRGQQGSGVIHLVDGEVAWVSTTGFGLPSFARRLIDGEIVGAHELDLVLALCKAEKLNFIEMLLRLELADAGALSAALSDDVRAHMKALLSMREVEGSWERGSLSFSGELTVPLDDVLSMDELGRWGLIIAHVGGSLGERRDEERLPLHAIAGVDAPRGHVLMMTENISKGGALLRSPCILDIGDKIIVKLTVGEEKLTLPGTVTRFRRCGIRAPQAVGVRWGALDDEQERALERVLAGL